MTKTALFEKRLAKFKASHERKRALRQAKARKRRNALARKRYRAQRRQEIPLLLELIKNSQRVAAQQGLVW